MKPTQIQTKIHEFRGQKVMLDYDLAALFEVETRRLNEQVKRNIVRFPADFMFQLNRDEFQNLLSQNATSREWGGKRKLPYAFTEHGVAMLAGVLKSEKAIQMSIAVVRAFIALKSFALNYKELAEKLTELEQRYNRQFADVYEALSYLVNDKMQAEHQKDRRRIGFRHESGE